MSENVDAFFFEEFLSGNVLVLNCLLLQRSCRGKLVSEKNYFVEKLVYCDYFLVFRIIVCPILTRRCRSFFNKTC